MKRKTKEYPGLISLSLPDNFIKDFIEYWENVKRILAFEGKSIFSWKKRREISRSMYETLTSPFYDKWKHIGRISWIKSYIKAFSSIILNFKGGSMLLPHRLVLYESIKPNNLLLSSLKENPSNTFLERILTTLCGDLNIKLLNSDLKIIQKLSQPGFSKSLDRYPKLKELAYGIRRDVRTVSSRLDHLFQNRILVHLYLVDMARIGYQTMMIIHNKERSEILKNFEPYIVMFFPLSTQDVFLSILQYPHRDIKAYKKLLEFFNPKDKVKLTAQYMGWNFSGLTRHPNERWELLPPILQDGGNWSKRIIAGETGVEFNLDPYYDPLPVTYRQARLLGIIHKLSTMEEDLLAEELKISRAYITADAKKLLKNRVIFRFPLFFNLGLGSWIYFHIHGLTTSRMGGLMNIIEHLKFFPYVNVFYNLNDGILAGRVNIPPSWTNRFIFRLTSLPQTYPKCSCFYYIGPETYVPWGFDILGTFDWDYYPHKSRY